MTVVHRRHTRQTETDGRTAYDGITGAIAIAWHR